MAAAKETELTDNLDHGFLTWGPWVWFKGLIGFADISITTTAI